MAIYHGARAPACCPGSNQRRREYCACCAANRKQDRGVVERFNKCAWRAYTKATIHTDKHDSAQKMRPRAAMSRQHLVTKSPIQITAPRVRHHRKRRSAPRFRLFSKRQPPAQQHTAARTSGSRFAHIVGTGELPGVATHLFRSDATVRLYRMRSLPADQPTMWSGA